MREFQEKKKNRRRLYSWWSIALLALVVVLFARGSWLVYQKDRQSKIDLAETNRQLAILQARHDLLTTQISSLQTEQGKED